MKVIMMKTIFLFLTVFVTTAYAADMSKYACMHMEVVIKNNTPNTCYLLTEELTNDSILVPGHDISFKIAPNEASAPLDIYSPTFDGETLTSVELVYECGEGAYIRLDTQKNACGSINTVNAAVLYAANLHATAEKNVASYWSNKPAKITWTIE